MEDTAIRVDGDDLAKARELKATAEKCLANLNGLRRKVERAEAEFNQALSAGKLNFLDLCDKYGLDSMTNWSLDTASGELRKVPPQ